jgi:hypothetical protein
VRQVELHVRCVVAAESCQSAMDCQ